MYDCTCILQNVCAYMYMDERMRVSTYLCACKYVFPCVYIYLTKFIHQYVCTINKRVGISKVDLSKCLLLNLIV